MSFSEGCRRSPIRKREEQWASRYNGTNNNIMKRIVKTKQVNSGNARLLLKTWINFKTQNASSRLIRIIWLNMRIALLCVWDLTRRVNTVEHKNVYRGCFYWHNLPHSGSLYKNAALYFCVSHNLSYWLKTMYSNCNCWVAPQRYRPRDLASVVWGLIPPHPKGRWRQSSIFTCDELRGRPARARPCWPPLRPLKRLAWSFVLSAPISMSKSLETCI